MEGAPAMGSGRTGWRTFPGRAWRLGTVPTLVLVAWMVSGPSPALARMSGTPRGQPPALARLGQSGVGADLSFPNCQGPLPLARAFIVVGVDGGLASVANPCLSKELGWAAYHTSGQAPVAPVALYLNTGNPGNSYLGDPVEDWPHQGGTPLGSCLPGVWSDHLLAPGQNSPACSWEYGFLRAHQDLLWLRAAAKANRLAPTADGYDFWLDVETSNSWQDQAGLNVATLEGMVYSLRQSRARSIGVYSSPQDWQEITGAGAASPSLHPLPDWALGTGDLNQALALCASPGLTGGPVVMAQFLPGGFDADYAC
ncbi:MAG: hypothetical protein ACREOL_09255 [Candidatus Dormibacteria bacterium]